MNDQKFLTSFQDAVQHILTSLLISEGDSFERLQLTRMVARATAKSAAMVIRQDTMVTGIFEDGSGGWFELTMSFLKLARKKFCAASVNIPLPKNAKPIMFNHEDLRSFSQLYLQGSDAFYAPEVWTLNGHDDVHVPPQMVAHALLSLCIPKLHQFWECTIEFSQAIKLDVAYSLHEDHDAFAIAHDGHPVVVMHFSNLLSLLPSI